MFSEKTLACLYKAGWSEGYVADITPYQQSAAAEGCPLPEIVTNFLTKFGRLQIAFPSKTAGMSDPPHAAEGCSLPAIVTNFLSRLQIAFPSKTIVKFRDHDILSLAGEMGSESCEELEFFAEKTGVNRVYMIGWIGVELLLLMDLEENVYLFYGNSLGGSVWHIASSGETAIEAFCSRKYMEDVGIVIKKW